MSIKLAIIGSLLNSGGFTPISVTQPVSLVQSKWSSTGVPSASVTLTGVTSGNFIIVTACVIETSPAINSACCFDGGTSYTLNHSSSVLNSFFIFGAWSKTATSNGNLNITVTGSGGVIGAVNMCAYEVANLTSKVFDTGSYSTGHSTNPQTTLFNTTATGIVLLQETEQDNNTVLHSSASNWTISDGGTAKQNDNSSIFQSGCAEHQVNTASFSNDSGSVILDLVSTWQVMASAYK